MALYANRGEWVQIHQVVLTPGERSKNLPDDTKKVPLELWVKGFIDQYGEVGDEVEITTVTGRKVRGTLVFVNPGYVHDFGECIPELLHIGPQLKEILKEGNEHA